MIFTYLYGSPEEVRCKRTARSLSSIESQAVREAVLAPYRQSNQSSLVIGVFQQTPYKYAPIGFEAKLETFSQQAVQAIFGNPDPYPSSLISLIYHGGRASGEDIQKLTLPDLLNRIKYLDSRTVPHFSAKSFENMREIIDYDVFISHVRKAEEFPKAAKQLDALHKWNRSFGLTRVEALEYQVLQQSMTDHMPEFKQAAHELHNLLNYLKMLREVEKHREEETQKKQQTTQIIS